MQKSTTFQNIHHVAYVLLSFNRSGFGDMWQMRNIDLS